MPGILQNKDLNVLDPYCFSDLIKEFFSGLTPNQKKYI